MSVSLRTGDLDRRSIEPLSVTRATPAAFVHLKALDDSGLEIRRKSDDAGCSQFHIVNHCRTEVCVEELHS